MRLCFGVGSYEEGKACWMAAVGLYVGTNDDVRWSDHVPCVDFLIQELCIRYNDMLSTDEERESVISPHLFAPVGTAGPLELQKRRIEYALDWLRPHAKCRESRFFLGAASEATSLIDTSVQLGRCARWCGVDFLRLILDLCAMGDRVEVAPGRSKEAVLEFLQ